MIAANMERLKDKVVRPDMDKHLIPLLLYRGSVSLGRMQRAWNFALTMMESEVETFTEAVHLSMNPDFSHLIGPRTRVSYGSIQSLFGRLRDHRDVTDNIPGLSAYCRDVRGVSWRLTPISIYTNSAKCKTPWRIYQKPPTKPRTAKAKVSLERSSALFYPYLIHKPKEGDSERELMLAVNAAVPAHLPDFIRSDICQDLLLAILAGEISRAELAGSVRAYTSKVFQMHPMKYGPISLDAPPPWDRDGRPLIETLEDESEPYWEDEDE